MEFLEKKYIFICAPYLDGIDNINYVDISILSNIREEYSCFCKQWDESYIYKISRIATFFRKYLIFLKKSSILNITGGTPEFACVSKRWVVHRLRMLNYHFINTIHGIFATNQCLKGTIFFLFLSYLKMLHFWTVLNFYFRSNTEFS